MKALTLKQPWASLVANGSKAFETRSWSTPYRGPIAIHASKAFDGADAVLVEREPFFSALKCSWRDLPTGAVIATGLLTAVTPTRETAASILDGIAEYGDPDGRARGELAFGDYNAGRYAWLIQAVAPLEEPIPMRGHLGLWETDLHPALELAELQVRDVAATGASRCRRCGCTDNLACDEGCGWVEDDLCSSCAPAGSVAA